jgi:multimeric flavodoxin WrbA
MKVLVINGSPHEHGTTMAALDQMIGVFREEGVEVEYLQIGQEAIRGCTACGACRKLGKCMYDDSVNKASAILKEADGIVVGTPVYYASANGTVVSFLDRLFFSMPFDPTMKVACAIGVARRGGLTSTMDQLNKYFTKSSMPLATTNYWNGVHGHNYEEAQQDEEGLHGMRELARNMVFLMRSIALGKEKYGLPVKEKKPITNFIR